VAPPTPAIPVEGGRSPDDETPDVISFRPQHEVHIPLPSQLHPNRETPPSGAVLRTIGPEAARRRRRIAPAVPSWLALGVMVVVMLGLAVAVGAAIAWGLTVI
jgi:hypothetical protein